MQSDPSHTHEIENASTTEGLPVAPSIGPTLRTVPDIHQSTALSPRVLAIAFVACGIAVVAAVVAQLLGRAISGITNLAFYGRLSLESVSPAGNQLGPWVVVVPVIGAIVVGVMARFGSAAIRGHGIPEAMEQVLFNQSRIPARMTLLKPLSSVIAIGTGGPFGAEGPIIATGGAFGSLVGQLVEITAEERKVLLAAGAAAGMSATFGTPVAAVLLAVELLLFEYRSRSLIPVALASVTASAVRFLFVGGAPAFVVDELAAPTADAIAAYVAVGVVAGVGAVAVTKAVYAVEDAFARLPIHWMWWPALGAIPVGIIGYFAPRTMGVGYENIEQIVTGTLTGRALLVLCTLKLCSWLVALGSGTSGGTLAPLFTIGGGLGAGTAALLAVFAPHAGIDPRVGALVGMAALFAGASRALLASVLFAFETTRQTQGVLPLLGGCCAAYLVSGLSMKHSIMTEKIARRGLRIPADYAADYLDQILVRDVALRPIVTVSASSPFGETRQWLEAATGPGAKHQGFPVVGEGGNVLGVLTRRDLVATGPALDTPLERLLKRPLVAIEPDASLREAADRMVEHRIGRLPVIADGKLVGIVTRSDLIEAHGHRLTRENQRHRARRLRLPLVPARR